MISEFLKRMFSPAPTQATSHAGCVDVVQHDEVFERARALAVDNDILHKRLAEMEARLESAEARAATYGEMFGVLRKAAFPVSYLLTEGSIEESMAINSRLWALLQSQEGTL